MTGLVAHHTGGGVVASGFGELYVQGSRDGLLLVSSFCGGNRGEQAATALLFRHFQVRGSSQDCGVAIYVGFVPGGISGMVPGSSTSGGRPSADAAGTSGGSSDTCAFSSSFSPSFQGEDGGNWQLREEENVGSDLMKS